MVWVYRIIGTDRHGSRSQPKPEKTMRGYYKHEAENAISVVADLMTMIIRNEKHIACTEAAIAKAQLKLDQLVQLMEEIKLVSGCELSHDLSNRISKKTLEAGNFFMKPNA